jgi:hypothetical protein
MSDDTIFGVDISAMQADRLANRFIRRDWIAIERQLITGKWFEYRFLNPVAATYLFAHEFKKAYREAYSRNVDTAVSAFITPLPANLFDAKRVTISGVWRARQVADAMGMPYDIYLQRAFFWTLRYWQRTHLPRPAQLYSDRVIERVAADWEESQSTRLYYSIKPPFKAVNYDARVKTLDDHHEHLFGLIDRRSLHGAAVLAEFLDEDLLPADKVCARLSPEMYQRARSLSHPANRN